jgi:hypothetical protein
MCSLLITFERMAMPCYILKLNLPQTSLWIDAVVCPVVQGMTSADIERVLGKPATASQPMS